MGDANKRRDKTTRTRLLASRHANDSRPPYSYNKLSGSKPSKSECQNNYLGFRQRCLLVNLYPVHTSVFTVPARFGSVSPCSVNGAEPKIRRSEDGVAWSEDETICLIQLWGDDSIQRQKANQNRTRAAR